MKIRRKDDHSQVREVNEVREVRSFYPPWSKAHDVGHWFDTDRGCTTFFSADVWEPVPDDIWDDVTHECEWHGEQRGLVHIKGGAVLRIAGFPDRYRVIKVNTTIGYSISAHLGVAFIVTRKRHA